MGLDLGIYGGNLDGKCIGYWVDLGVLRFWREWANWSGLQPLTGCPLLMGITYMVKLDLCYRSNV